MTSRHHVLRITNENVFIETVSHFLSVCVRHCQHLTVVWGQFAVDYELKVNQNL